MPPKKAKKPKATADPMAAVAQAYSYLDQAGSADAGRARLAQLQDTLGKRFGKSTALTLSVAPHARVRRMPWGILMLDWKAPLVIGRVNRLWGRKSTLKSTLCLRALRSAQNHCRHCKSQMVRHPNCRCKEHAKYAKLCGRLNDVLAAMGPIPEPGTELTIEFDRLTAKRLDLEARFPVVKERSTCAHAAGVAAGEVKEPCVDCECPKPRWWLADEADYDWLPAATTIELYYGRLPTGVKWKKPKDADIAMPVLHCEPPAHAFYNKDGTPKKQKPKARDVPLRPMRRCEPMRCFYVDSEGTIDNTWAEAQGVDLDLVTVMSNTWGEAVLESIEEATLTQEFDFLVIDSTSVLEPQKEHEKSIQAAPKVAAKATMMGRWVTRQITAMFDQGMTARYQPTILCTSQVTMKGLGGGITPYSGPTDGNRFEHALSLDIKMVEKGYYPVVKDGRNVRGKFEFTVRKNKAGGAIGDSGVIDFFVEAVPGHPVGDSQDLTTVMDHARGLNTGFIEKGSGQRLLTVKSRHLPGGEACFARVGDCEAFLRANQTIYDDLRARVLRQLRANDVALVVRAGHAEEAVAT